MLDNETKRRIDTARDILVGKVPDPKSQVEQITIALIYKFMDDMDAEAEELGGVRKFFTGNFARYGWAKLMSAGVGGHELIGLYSEGISTMPQNDGIPVLFRDIFKNAYLPYRDPETLKSFLKVIDEFTYDHSERLGDAFEYLLSVLGSQGDAGQFRTPRHIIDFMVEIMAPKKGEVVLDPACGTAGFLISAYKYILSSNVDAEGNTTLTPDEKGNLASHFKGYDISPDMVRLSLVNLYLHGFNDPHIYEYDTLTSEERWNEYADVVLANPPFMSPKGGIKPHKRFSIQAKRSEVLFVDYMAEHLTPTGRAAIIVPEGIIFQNQGAYQDLRRLLVENSLVAVISLPSGCFNPYSGVKTSILILDKSLAKQSDTIAFFKVENDGFGLGAQRRAIDKNDLPQVQLELTSYLKALRVGKYHTELNLSCGLVVEKEKISATGDYTLSGERYRANIIKVSDFPFVAIQDVAEVASGFGFPLDEQGKGSLNIPFLKVSDMNLPGNEIWIKSWNHSISLETLKQLGAKSFPKGTVIFPKIGAAIATNKKRILACESTYDNNVMGIIPGNRLMSEFLYALMQSIDLSTWASTSHPPSMRKSVVEAHSIPLPPLEVQKEIVAEIEVYQKIINGARTVLESYQPHIFTQPNWPLVELGKVCVQVTDGSHFSPEIFSTGYPYVTVKDLEEGIIDLDGCKKINEESYKQLVNNGCKPKKGDVLFSKDGTVGKTALVNFEEDFVVLSSLAIFTPNLELIIPEFLYHIVSTDKFINTAIDHKTGVAIKRIVLRTLKTILIPLPTIIEQQAIISEINAELALVNANRELIIRFEKKIQSTLARIWGEESLVDNIH